MKKIFEKNFTFRTCIHLIFPCILLLSSSDIYGETTKLDGYPSLVSSLGINTVLDFCGEETPMENTEVRERFEKELMLTLWDRPQVILWLKRSRRYLPHIEDTLRKNNMPDDLKYVAIAESALRPHAGSKKGAIGFWQFITGTGRKYGLVINEYFDERRNIFSSTTAAVHYLNDLHETFNSWTLAVAGYNMGEEGLMAEIMEQGLNNYYQLYLPLETQRYIFRILSIKLIFSNPERYGFRLGDKDYYPPLAFEGIQVDCPEEIPIRVIAQAGKTHFKVIKDLNPEIRGHYLAKGKHNILFPAGASEGFRKRYAANVEKYLTSRKERVYIVKKGDNLSSIADRFGVPLVALIIWNRINIAQPIHPGDRLIIHSEEIKLNETE
ncbi:transglycosylase SLT domain-containing protein [Thermodesulfobacteriota bacterium]